MASKVKRASKVKQVLAYVNKHETVTADEVLEGSFYARIVLSKLAKQGRIVRIGWGRYASLKSGLQDIEAGSHKKAVLVVVAWDRCVTAADVHEEAKISSMVYTYRVLADLVMAGTLVRVRRGWYARKGSKFDRQTPPKGVPTPPSNNPRGVRTPPVDPFS